MVMQEDARSAGLPDCIRVRVRETSPRHGITGRLRALQADVKLTAIAEILGCFLLLPQALRRGDASINCLQRLAALTGRTQTERGEVPASIAADASRQTSRHVSPPSPLGIARHSVPIALDQ